MSDKSKTALINGIFTVIVAVVTGIFSYTAGSKNPVIPANNNNYLTVTVNGETVSVKPEDYEDMYTELEAKNAQLTSELEALKGENSALEQKNAALQNENNTPSNSLPNEAEPTPTATSEVGPQSEDAVFMPELIPAYQSSRYKEYSEQSGREESFFMAGKQYTNGMIWSTYNVFENVYSLYTLDGKYSEISGILGHVDGTDMHGKSFEIYFDGKLYKEVLLAGDMMAQPFSIDVTGVNQLKLMIPSSNGDPQYGFANVTIQ